MFIILASDVGDIAQATVDGLVEFSPAYLVLVSIVCASLAAAGFHAALSQSLGWFDRREACATFLASGAVAAIVYGIAVAEDVATPWVHFAVAGAFGLASHKTGPVVQALFTGVSGWLRRKFGGDDPPPPSGKVGLDTETRTDIAERVREALKRDDP